MAAFAKKIEGFLLSNTVWIFFTAMIVTTLIVVDLNKSASWLSYLSWLLIFCLLFLPVLLFSTFRDWLKNALRPGYFWSLWAFCFVAYPAIITFLRAHFFYQLLFIPLENEDFIQRLSSYFLFTIGQALFLIEVVIQLNRGWLKKMPSMQWLKKISLEKTILLLLFLFATAVAVFEQPAQLISDSPKTIGGIIRIITQFSSYTIQVFLIFLGGYFFYFINHYWLIPTFFKQKGAIYYAFSLLASIFICYPIIGYLMLWIPIVPSLANYEPDSGMTIFEAISNLMANGLVPFSIMVLSFPFILAIEWFKQRSEITALEKEKSETELSLLKQQINPHFFFNTLNNLYALSITKDEQTPEVVMQLSELMRYVIYKGKEEEVPLASEVKYIEDYIRLQQIRLHKKVDFRFDKEIKNDQLMIPPLLFIILVENAFKHGIEPAEKACFLHIGFKSDENGLIFTCENSFEEKLKGEEGIGLTNLKRRLELRFPNQHQLQIEENSNTFKAVLKLDL